MKKLISTLLAVISLTMVHSQQFNPYVSEGMMSPAPLLPYEFEGRGTASFTLGNSGSSALPLVADQEMGLVVSLINGVPDSNNPLDALSGSWASYFDWTYLSQFNSFVGVQNQSIPAQSFGKIEIGYRVTNNTTQQVSGNGFNVNIQPPPYSIGINNANDDFTNGYTYVRATDYGDAPSSYGAAGAQINLFKSNGVYTNFVMLGDTIDHEGAYQPTMLADGDNNTGINDEDGVIFPALIKSETVTISIKTTVRGNSFGFLNGWIDWNGDGDFLDAGEQIIFSQVITTSQTVPITVSVPVGAVTGHTFARFRFGAQGNSTAFTSYGEVEDYQILIQENTPGLLLYKEGIFEDENGNGFAEVGESISYQFTVYNSGNQTISGIEIEDDRLSSERIALIPSVLLPGESGMVMYSILITESMIASGGVYNQAVVYGETPSGQEVSALSVDPDPLPQSSPDFDPECPDCTFTKLLKANSISGVVWEDMNGNGVKNTDEPEIIGVIANLYTEQDVLVRTVVSDSNGQYAFVDLNVGNYYVEFLLPEGYEFTFAGLGDSTELNSGVDNSYGIGTTGLQMLSDSLSLSTVNAGMYICVQHSGFVWYDENENDLRDTWEDGMNNIPVSLYRIMADGEIALWETLITVPNPSNTSEHGYFEVCTPPGFYYVQFPVISELLSGLVPVQQNVLGNIPLGEFGEQANDSDINFMGRTELFNVRSGGRVETIGAGYYAMANVGSIVWLDENKNGLQDNGESGVEGIVVEAFNENNQKVRETITATDGSYELDYLMAGMHYIRFTAPEGYSFGPFVPDQSNGNKVSGLFGAGTTNPYILTPGGQDLEVNAGLILGVLPVIWLDVMALRTGDKNRVRWTIAEEDNVERYEIYRSTLHQRSFEKQGEVRASFNGNTGQLAYEWIDDSSQEDGLYYYYVENVDVDGRRSRSKVVSVKVEGQHIVKVFPNPARGVVTVSLNPFHSAQCNITLFTQEGKLVKQYMTKHHISSQEDHKLNLEGIESGIYMLNIKIGEKEFDKKLIIIE